MKYDLVSPTPPWLKWLTFPETSGVVILTRVKILLMQQISKYTSASLHLFRILLQNLQFSVLLLIKSSFLQSENIWKTWLLLVSYFLNASQGTLKQSEPQSLLHTKFLNIVTYYRKVNFKQSELHTHPFEPSLTNKELRNSKPYLGPIKVLLLLLQ